MKKIITLFVSILFIFTASCGKKGPPVYQEKSKVNIDIS